MPDAETKPAETLLDDVCAVEEAINRLGDKVQPNHFFKIKARRLADMAGLPLNDGPEWNSRLADVLLVLSDTERVQVVISGDGKDYVFLRRWAPLHSNVCAPMYAVDVEAICAMVGGKGLVELEAIPRNQLTDLKRHGCKTLPAMQECLQKVLAHYTEAGAVLPDDSNKIDEFVERAADEMAERRARYEEHETATLLAEPEPTAEESEMSETDTELETDGAGDNGETDAVWCPRCSSELLNNGYPVCETCAGALLQLEEDGPERAVAADRRSGGKVLVGGMIFEPERIRRLLGKAVRVTREIQNTMLPPLTDELEDDEEPLNVRDRDKLLHQVDARVSDLRSILSSLRAEFVEDDDHASRLSQFGGRKGK